VGHFKNIIIQGVEHSSLEKAEATEDGVTVIFSAAISDMLNFDVSGDGSRADNPFSGAPNNPGTRYNTNENTAIIRNSLKVLKKGRSLSWRNLILPIRYRPINVNITIQIAR